MTTPPPDPDLAALIDQAEARSRSAPADDGSHAAILASLRRLAMERAGNYRPGRRFVLGEDRPRLQADK